jgi:putative endonuclease
MKDWLVYLLRCADGTLYCGVTNNLLKRIRAHNASKGGSYTRGRVPVRLEAQSRELTRSEALKLEMRVKKAQRRKKIEIIAGG